MKVDGATIFQGCPLDPDAGRWCFANARRTFEFCCICDFHIALCHSCGNMQSAFLFLQATKKRGLRRALFGFCLLNQA